MPPTEAMIQPNKSQIFHVKKPITSKITLSLIHSKFYNFFFSSSFKKEINRGKLFAIVKKLWFPKVFLPSEMV